MASSWKCVQQCSKADGAPPFLSILTAGWHPFVVSVNSLGPLMNTLYTQLPDLTNPDTFTSSRGGDRRNRRSSSSSSSSQARRRTRSSTRANQRAFDFTNDDTYLPDDLGAGFGAFADMLGRSNDQESWNGGGGGGGGGVDFASLLRTLVTEGQRQGIDALSALRAAGRVQDELRSFQSDPSAWFEGVSERFRTSSGTPEVAGAGAGRSATTGRTMRSRSRAGAGGINAQPADSWWSNLNDFFVKREPSQQQQHDSRSRTRRRRRNAPPPSSFDDDAYHDDDDDYNV